MVRGSILRGVITIAAVAVVAYISLGDAERALARHPRHYASQYTAQADGFFHHDDQPPAPYYGWVGVNGQITTPSTIPRLNSVLDDHALGFVDMTSSAGGWVQAGWFTGIVGEQGNYIVRGIVSTYVEHKRNDGTFYVEDLGAPSPGEAITYRIERHSAAGCWNVYIYYSSLIGTFCGLNNSGAAEATSEVLDGTGGGMESPVEMEVSNWEWSNPNTNQALRLKGGCVGFEPWDTALCAKFTARYDERIDDPTYRISHYNTWFYFTAYGENSP